jgi:polyphosphate kinase 2 (PPK2 family)
MSRVQLASLDVSARIDDDAYETALPRLQHKLGRIQQAYFVHGERAVVVLEGVDASGKGGLIRRVTWALDPRGFRVWPIAAPTPEEQAQHWLQRFWTRMPARGRIAIFDRSWYGRVLVERVEGFASKEAWKRAYGEIRDLERHLVDDGVRVIKLFLHVSPEEQLRRFHDRLRDPAKRWKLGFEDFRNRARHLDHVEAIEDMLHETHTHRAPWHVVASDHKRWARVRALEILSAALAEGVDLSPPPIDPRLEALARAALDEG